MGDLAKMVALKMKAQKAEHDADGGGDGGDAGGRRPVAVPTSREKVAKKMKVPVAQVVEVKKTEAVKMGRPKKEVVMTAAERARAYRARKRARSS